MGSSSFYKYPWCTDVPRTYFACLPDPVSFQFLRAIPPVISICNSSALLPMNIYIYIYILTCSFLQLNLLDPTVNSADRQCAPDGDGENSSMSSVPHSGLRKCPTQRDSRSERSGSPQSTKWRCPRALPWFQSPQHPVPSLPSLLPVLVIFFLVAKSQ